MIIDRSHDNFESTLDMLVNFMLDKGTTISDIEGFKKDVLHLEVDEETNEISIKCTTLEEEDNE